MTDLIYGPWGGTTRCLWEEGGYVWVLKWKRDEEGHRLFHIRMPLSLSDLNLVDIVPACNIFFLFIRTLNWAYKDEP